MKKITVSLREVDANIIGELMKLTGAYTISKVVRDALRHEIKRVKGGIND